MFESFNRLTVMRDAVEVDHRIYHDSAAPLARQPEVPPTRTRKPQPDTPAHGSALVVLGATGAMGRLIAFEYPHAFLCMPQEVGVSAGPLDQVAKLSRSRGVALNASHRWR